MIPPKSSEQQNGFTLLEVTISMFVVAVGLLGVLGMQLQTLIDTQNGVARGRSVHLMRDLGERMHSSPGAMNYIDGYLTAFSDTGSCPNPRGTFTADTVSTHDTVCWKQNLERQIPDSQATIFRVATEQGSGKPRQLGVMIAWAQKSRKTTQSSDPADLNTIFEITATTAGAASQTIECPDEMICHLQYVQPGLRCTTDELGDETFFCMDGLYPIAATR